MKRPLSPHLQVYNIFSKEMTSSLSILHRLAGFVLLGSIFFLCIMLYMMNQGEHSYMAFVKFMTTNWFGIISSLGIGAGFLFYLITELRFLIMATGCGLQKKQVMIHGWMATIIFFILFGLFAYFCVIKNIS